MVPLASRIGVNKSRVDFWNPFGQIFVNDFNIQMFLILDSTPRS